MAERDELEASSCRNTIFYLRSVIMYYLRELEMATQGRVEPVCSIESGPSGSPFLEAQFRA